VYALVEHTPATVLLESAREGANESRSDSLSRLFTAPLSIVEAHTPAELTDLFAQIESAVAAGHHAAGFFTYECGNCFEPKAAMCPGRAGQPLAWFGIFEHCHSFDHRTGGFLEGEPQGLAAFRPSASEPATGPAAAPRVDAALAIAEEQYAESIAAIHEWIRAGDVYQLNYTIPYQVQAPGSSAAVYAFLSQRQPVEYGAFIHWKTGRRILSFSPELFFRVDEIEGARRITAKPMKGTASRGRTTREDREHAEWLRDDQKNRAENVMIVDLLRNDLGRIAKFGTVRAEELFAVERYPTLWQMTSTVTATLRPKAGLYEIFRALFPCGSITGAPKVRAMQLLAELEEQPRGVYTGAIGFFSPRKTVFSVAIRTLEMDGDRGTMGVGSGIVIDSDPAQEFRECQLKAEFLLASRNPENFDLVETLLWQGGYPLIELHLDRLEDSAEYFGFCCSRADVSAALHAAAANFGDDSRRKVRLLLSADGEVQITSEILPATAADAKIVRACIASERTDPRDPMLFHKTTHRPLYAQAFKAASEGGFDDVLFFNVRGELTEGAISNVFLEKNGRLLTPPVECGLLAGVYRRHLLATQPNVEERVLTIEDLRHADAVYLANAVRGLREATIRWDDRGTLRLSGPGALS
jgi:para-aminobenzoate synthetase/4-amino-4-deoxychorismate lyase